VSTVDSAPSVLLAGLDDALARRVVAALDSLGLHFHRAPSVAAVGERSGLSAFDVVIVAFVGDRSVLPGLEKIDEWSGLNGRRPAVVLLCPGSLLGEAFGRVGGRVGRLVVLETLESELREVVTTMLGVAPRFQIRAPVRLTPVVAEESRETVGTTENISSSGMLVRCMEELPLGSTIRFMIAVPGYDLTIRGSARVVRASDPVREGTHGIGARFVSFVGSGRDSLNDLLSRHVH
jgi:hypothetical protein